MRVYGVAPRSAADAPAAPLARMDAATMSFFMEVLGNENISTAKVIGRLAQKLLPGCHRSRLFQRRAGPWMVKASRVVRQAGARPWLDPGMTSSPIVAEERRGWPGRSPAMTIKRSLFSK